MGNVRIIDIERDKRWQEGFFTNHNRKVVTIENDREHVAVKDEGIDVIATGFFLSAECCNDDVW